MTITMTTKAPTTFRRIHLELAREPGHPLGSGAFGYDLVAPLNADSQIDVDGWRQDRTRCRVVRIRPDEDHVVGHLIRRPGGSWAFRYDGDNDEVGLHFGDERFVAGEYVALRIDDEEHTFRVVTAEPL